MFIQSYLTQAKDPLITLQQRLRSIYTVSLYYNGKFKSANRERMCQMDLQTQYKINMCFRAYVERKYIGFISVASVVVKNNKTGSTKEAKFSQLQL